MGSRALEIRGRLEADYADIYTPEVVAALEALDAFTKDGTRITQNLDFSAG